MNKTETYTDQFAKEKFTKNDMWLCDSLVMECIMGSQAYGVQTPESDFDIFAVVMNQHQHLYPQNYGYVLGFDNIPSFKSKDLKGNKNKIVINEKDCEMEWHSFTDFFWLAAHKGSPNATEILFVRRPLVTFADDTGITWKLRDNRRMFLSMRNFHAFKGYAFQQLMRMKRGVNRWNAEQKCDNTKRAEYYRTYGYDIKMAYHPLRLLDNLHQIITEGDIDLMRNKDECLAMRKGEWGSFEKFEKYVINKLEVIEDMALRSTTLPNKPQLQSLHNLLAECIEDWYGSEEGFQKNQTEYVSVKMLMDRLDNMEKKIDKLKWI